MLCRSIAAVLATTILIPQCALAFSGQKTNPLNQTSASRWEGKSVTIRLVDDRLVSGRVVSVEADALVLQDSEGNMKRVRFVDVAAIGGSHRGPQILVAVAAVVILVSALICPRLGM